MFTGIIEALAKVERIEVEGTNWNVQLSSILSSELKPDQSLSHNGVCLTVTKANHEGHWVTIVHETLSKSNLGELQPGSLVNLERSMLTQGRFDGHIVQGHVDQTGIVKSIKDEGGSWLFSFEYKPTDSDHITVEKGSIAVNGVSLTCFNSSRGAFSVAIIPYTFEHTNFSRLKPGHSVNLEFDIIGKYVGAILGARRA